MSTTEPATKAPRARKPRRPKPPATRLVTVHFYRAVRDERVGDEWRWPVDGEVARMLLDAFDAGQTTRAGWPIATYWGKPLLVEAHRRDAPLQLGVSTVRSDDLPLVLRDGAMHGEPLPLGERDRLLEPSYLTFFGDRVVALVKHGHTPGHRMCAQALARLTDVDIGLVPILRPDVLQSVIQGNGLSSLDLTVAAGSIDAAAEQDDLVLAAEQLRARTPGAERLTVHLSAESASDKQRLRSRAIRLLQRRGTDGLAAAHARVLTDDAGSELVDLLEADLTSKARIEVEARMRHLTPDEAHTAALQAFSIQRVAITQSIGLAEE